MEIKRRNFIGAGAAIGLGMATRSVLGKEPAGSGTAVRTQCSHESLTSPDTPKLARQFKSGAFKDGSGNTLPYRYFEPAAGGAAGARYPVILYLHGEDEAGTDNNAQLVTTDCATVWTTPMHLAQNPAYVVAPQLAKGKKWTDEAPYFEALALLKQFTQSSAAADANRIYLVGFSMGATGVWNMLLKNPQLFAAAMPISGSAEMWLGNQQAWAPLKNTPVIIVHSYDDTVVPIDAGFNAAAALQAAGNTFLGFGAPTPCFWSPGSTPSPHDAWYTALQKFEVVYNSLFLGDLGRTEKGAIDPTTLYTHREMGDGITQVWDYALGTSWIVERDDKAVIVDTAMGHGGIYEYIRDHVLKNKNIDIEVFLTHKHDDHIRGLASFIGAAQLKKVYVHKEDSLPVIKMLGPDGGKVIPVKDGDLIALGGGNVEVIGVPGHTLGSIIVKYQRYLFSGDSVGTGYCGVGALSIQQYIQSLQHLLDRMGPGQYSIYAGHTGELSAPMSEQFVHDISHCARDIVDFSIPGPPYWRSGESSTRKVSTVGRASITYSISDVRLVKAALSGLEISPGNLISGYASNFSISSRAPGFSPSRQYYYASLGEDASHVAITPTVLDADYKSLTVNGAAIDSGEAYQGRLNAGNNRFAITVTASSGLSRNYILDVVKATQKG